MIDGTESVDWGGRRQASLPSSDAVALALSGDPAGILTVVGSTLLRAGLIAGGMYLAGVRGQKTLVRGSLGGALGIEAFVFMWVASQRKG